MKLGEAILWPLTIPYGAATSLRSAAYGVGVLRAKPLKGKVISVGNLTTGGTGKTPMVMWIADRLQRDGKRAAILTRGYRGKESPTGATSDEVDLLRSRLGDSIEFGIGADRFASSQELAKRGVEWFVLDDGFQHRQLARDADIVLIDATNPFGGGHLLPAGRLREPRSALKRADLVVITRSEHSPAVEAAIRRDSAAPIFYAQTELLSIKRASETSGGESAAASALGKVFAFCGIGNPNAFLSDLQRWGVNVCGHLFFRDHHKFTAKDADAIVINAKAADASVLICTEKDLRNLELAHFDLPVLYCAISLRIDRENDFWSAIMTAASRRTAFQEHR